MTKGLQLLVPLAVTPAMITSYDVPEPATGDSPDPAAYSSGTTYALAARVHVASVHKIYESVQAGNVGHDPTTDTTNTWWVEVGATNRWRMFDQKNTSQTTNVGGIDVSITHGSIVNAISLLNVTLVSDVTVTVTDPSEGVVYSNNVTMQEPPTVGDYYEYFFDPIVTIDTFYLTDLPTYRNATIRVQANTTAPSNVAGIGVLVLGQSKEIGIGIKMGATVGIQDYSRKERNAYGDMTIVERAYAKRADFEMWVPRHQVDTVVKLLASVRATPVVWIGNDYYRSTQVFGFYKDWETTIEYHDYSVLTISLEGLT